MKNFGRAFSAIIGGAASASIVANVCLFILISLTHGADGYGLFVSFLAFLFYAFILCLVIASTLGLAWHALAVSRGLPSAAAYYGPGAVVGFGTGTALILLLVASNGINGADWGAWAMTSAYGAALGGLTGLFAWLIRRPDRDHISDGASKSTSA